MGQRITYIIKEESKLTFYYNHWRAYSIPEDLYLGESRFLGFVRNCKPAEEILEEPWIEGCVVIDKDSKQLSFWPFEDIDTSIVEYYLLQLPRKWPGWNIQLARNRMYDIEKILGIDYLSSQQPQEFSLYSTEEVIADKVEEWTTALVIIRHSSGHFVTMTGNLNSERIVGYGPDIIPLLLDKPAYELPNEGEEGTMDECVLIDPIEKKLFINKSCWGLWEQSGHLWASYDFTMGDYGYLDVLQFAGLDASVMPFPLKEIRRQFDRIVQVREDFDPVKLAERIKKDDEDVQISPYFFDSVQPEKTFFERVRLRWRKLFGK